MDTVKVNNKTFAISIPQERIQQGVADMAMSINRDFAGKNPLFLCVLNGAFVFAADLLRKVTIPCEVTFVKLASYRGVESSGNVQTLLGLGVSLRGRTVIVLEDIIDTGLTMAGLLDVLRKECPLSVHVATLLVKPKKIRTDINVDYVAFSVPNDFIVGYGLDYDGQGRNLPDIYTLVE